MTTRQFLDSRWHWLRQALQKLYNELDDDATPASLTIIAAGDNDMVSYSMTPGIGDVDKRVIVNQSALIAAAEITTVDASVES